MKRRSTGSALELLLALLGALGVGATCCYAVGLVERASEVGNGLDVLGRVGGNIASALARIIEVILDDS